MAHFDLKSIDSILESALREDIGDGDITTNSLIPVEAKTSATLTTKASGVIAGLEIAEQVFKKLDSNIIWKKFVNDGDVVAKGTLIAKVEGSFRALLTGERTALNFLQRMSGIATATSIFVNAVKESNTKILDTRKTVPGLRLLDKYAVAAGGGTNHRIGLFDMVMIKDNHIKVAGSITRAVNEVRSKISSSIKIEVETTTLEEVKEALTVHPDVIMLDNMDNETMSKAVKLIDHSAKVEASGNMTLQRIRNVAATGVDFISIGALTHSVSALDISMNIEN